MYRTATTTTYNNPESIMVASEHNYNKLHIYTFHDTMVSPQNLWHPTILRNSDSLRSKNALLLCIIPIY